MDEIGSALNFPRFQSVLDGGSSDHMQPTNISRGRVLWVQGIDLLSRLCYTMARTISAKHVPKVLDNLLWLLLEDISINIRAKSYLWVLIPKLRNDHQQNVLFQRQLDLEFDPRYVVVVRVLSERKPGPAAHDRSTGQELVFNSECRV